MIGDLTVEDNRDRDEGAIAKLNTGIGSVGPQEGVDDGVMTLLEDEILPTTELGPALIMANLVAEGWDGSNISEGQLRLADDAAEIGQLKVEGVSAMPAAAQGGAVTGGIDDDDLVEIAPSILVIGELRVPLRINRFPKHRCASLVVDTNAFEVETLVSGVVAILEDVDDGKIGINMVEDDILFSVDLVMEILLKHFGLRESIKEFLVRGSGRLGFETGMSQRDESGEEGAEMDIGEAGVLRPSVEFQVSTAVHGDLDGRQLWEENGRALVVEPIIWRRGVMAAVTAGGQGGSATPPNTSGLRSST